jgi:hypothetical protein
LPDASKKMHVLKPFVLVGSPMALIAPWLKTLQGTKTFPTEFLKYLSEDGKVT